MDKIKKSGFIFIGVIIVIGLFLYNNDSVTMSDIVAIIPDRGVWALVVVLLIYSLKSVTVFFPLYILYVSVGVVFESYVAVLVNALGLLFSLSLPYWIGRYSGKSFVDTIVGKYQRMSDFKDLQQNNEWMTTYLFRTLGPFPGDIVSFYFGSLGIEYFTYLSASLLGMIPRMVAITLLGVTGLDVRSMTFWLLIMVNVLIVVVSLIVRKHLAERKEKLA